MWIEVNPITSKQGLSFVEKSARLEDNRGKLILFAKGNYNMLSSKI
jgi:hypothetical protein